MTIRITEVMNKELHRCKNCDFAIPKNTGLVGRWFAECRRFPPKPDVISNGPQTIFTSQFPVISDGPEFYCGELSIDGRDIFKGKLCK